MTNTTVKNHTFTKNVTAVTAEIDGQLVALDVNTGVCFGLNEVATEIWKQLDTHSDPSGISEALMQIYEIDQETCEIETQALLAELVSEGLVNRT